MKSNLINDIPSAQWDGAFAAEPLPSHPPAASVLDAQVVVVDLSIAGVQAIIDAIQPGVRIITFDGATDGLHGVAEALAGTSGLAAIHLISHGAPGEARFGNDSLSQSSIADHASDLAAIGRALGAGGQLDLYGCDIAAGGTGLIEAISQAVGRTVAASTDLTGSATYGGNWTLEASTGAPAVSLPADFGALQAFQGELVTASAAVHGNGAAPGNMVRVYDTTSDTSGHVYVTGAYRGSVDFGGTTLVEPASAGSGANTAHAFVAEYDAAGALIWVKGFAGAPGNYQDIGTSIAVTPDGSKIFVGGAFSGTINLDATQSLTAPGSASGGFVVQLDTNGAYSSNTNLIGSNGQASALVQDLKVDSAGNLFGIARYSTNATTVGTVTLSAPGGASNLGSTVASRNGAAIFQITSGGAIGWTAKVAPVADSFGNAGDAAPSALAIDGSNNVYVTGTFYDVNFTSAGGGVVRETAPAGSGYGAYLAKLSSAGVFQWQHKIVSTPLTVSVFDHDPYIYDVAITKDGNPVIVGSYSDGTIIGGTTQHTYLKPSSSGSYFYASTRAFVEQVNASNGASSWYKVESDNGKYASDYANKVAVDAAGSVIVAGVIGAQTAGSINFDGKSVTPPVGSDPYNTHDGFVWTLTPGSSSATTLMAGSFPGGGGNDSIGGINPATGGGVNLWLNVIGTVDGNPGPGVTTVGSAGVSSSVNVRLFSGDLNENTPPTQHFNTGSTVLEGGTVVIGATMLDFDDAEQADTAITYTVGVLPLNGALRKSGVALTAGGTFTQDDLNNSRITYVHNGGETTSDSFAFSVADGQGGVVTGRTFALTVTPVNDPPTVTASGVTATFTEGGPPVALFSGVAISTVETGQNIDQIVFDATGVIAGDVLTIDGAALNLSANGTVVTTSGFSAVVTHPVSASAARVVLNRVGGVSASTVAAFIQAATFSTASDDPGAADRVVTLTSVRDTGGTANGGSDTKLVGVSSTTHVLPVNDAPTGLTGAGAFSAPEISANGTAVGTVTGADPDNTAAQLTYSLTNNAGGRFTISSTGAITVANGLLLDYEQATSHSITVRVTDPGGLFFDRVFLVQVSDVNPETVTGGAGADVFVGGRGGHAVGRPRRGHPHRRLRRGRAVWQPGQ